MMKVRGLLGAFWALYWVARLFGSIGIWSGAPALPTEGLKPGSPSAPPNYTLGYPKYHLIETIRPLIHVHWGV